MWNVPSADGNDIGNSPNVCTLLLELVGTTDMMRITAMQVVWDATLYWMGTT